jgi:hypothetical protein
LDILSIDSKDKVKNREYDRFKRIYCSMRRFCPPGFQVVSDHESEEDDSQMPDVEYGDDTGMTFDCD